MTDIFNINDANTIYFVLIFYSLVALLILNIIKRIIKFFLKFIKSEKTSYTIYSIVRIIVSIIYGAVLIFLWSGQISNLITLVSFLSAGFAIAIRDLILNWICGIIIKINKPLKVEDRIIVNDIMGDVISISSLSFEVLEVNTKEKNGQSTGIVVNFPNSVIFTSPLKNLTKGFKYVWNEMKINVPLDSDLAKNKQTIYKIVNNIDTIKSIPRKMKNQINEVNTTYRIYYNNYEPIIYTEIEEDHIALYLRYLIHPKKARYIESTIWNKLYEAYKEGDLKLYTKGG